MKKIGIIGAMDLEVEALKARMEAPKVTKKARMEFYEGMLAGVPAVVVRCGIGKVNAALCVQLMADLFQVTHIINTGIAGSLNADLDIGDILISVDAIQHDMDVRVFGYALGEVPSMGTREFAADQRMGQLALELCAKVNPGVKARLGRVVTGDQFICDAGVKDHLVREFSADCTEMEGGAIAQAAWLNGIPFVILRAISDKADNSAEMDYPTFERIAAANSARLAEALAAEV